MRFCALCITSLKVCMHCHIENTMLEISMSKAKWKCEFKIMKLFGSIKAKNTTRYYLNHCNYQGRTQIRFSQKDTHITTALMSSYIAYWRCLLSVFWTKLTPHDGTSTALYVLIDVLWKISHLVIFRIFVKLNSVSGHLVTFFIPIWTSVDL